MDLRDTSEEAASRAELRAWLEDNLSDELQGRRGGAARVDGPTMRAWSRALYDVGYSRPGSTATPSPPAQPLVEPLSTNPANLFGLHPCKGTIAPGSDADIVVFDPEKRHLITAATQHSKTDYNLYEGTEVTGSPETVLLRGNVLVENGDFVAEPGVGQFVERAAFGQELLPAAAR